LPNHYLRRNSHAAHGGMTAYVADYPDSHRVYPAHAAVQRFKLSGPPGRVTSACGLGVYRDGLLGEGVRGDVFVCEPVNLLVHRLKLSPKGSSFSGRRAAGEEGSEFLASTDGWHRPVQVRTGPDGALWVVDMYRFVIEHPRWIPKEDLARLDVRAGSRMGRIYRVRPADRLLGALPRLDRLGAAGLAAALESPNGTVRDLAGQMLLWRKDLAAVPAMRNLTASRRPEARLHALCVLDGLGKLRVDEVRRGLDDPHPGVRRHAVRLAEGFLAGHPGLGGRLAKMTGDGDAGVRLQLACSLGAWPNPRSAEALSKLALAHAGDPYLVAAVLSSLNADNVAGVLGRVLASKSPPQALARRLPGLAVALGDGKALSTVLARISTPAGGRYQAWQMAALAGVLEGAGRAQALTG